MFAVKVPGPSEAMNPSTLCPARPAFKPSVSALIASYPMYLIGPTHAWAGLLGPAAQPPPSGVLMNEPVTDELFRCDAWKPGNSFWSRAPVRFRVQMLPACGTGA